MSNGMNLFAKDNSARLLCSVLYNDEMVLERTIEALERRFGAIDAETPEMDFLHTRAYVEEMGDGIKRRMFLFVNPVAPSRLAEFKRQTLKIEEKLAEKVGNLRFRKVNIDPMTLTGSGITLASAKDAPQRVALERGVYAEKALALIGDRFRPFEWTSPDFTEPEALEFFDQALEYVKTLPAELTDTVTRLI
jgi:hypothetical protein